MVRGAAALARQLGVPPLVIGLTVVAFGTSAPERPALAAEAGVTDLAVGNVVGFFNLLFVLGVTSTIRPVPVPAGGLGTWQP